MGDGRPVPAEALGRGGAVVRKGDAVDGLGAVDAAGTAAVADDVVDPGVVAEGLVGVTGSETGAVVETPLCW